MFYVSTTFQKDNKSIFRAINLLSKNKIYNIELGSNHVWEKKLNFSKFKKYNFCVHNYFPVPKRNLVINIASQNKQIRKKSISQIKKSILFSKKINAKLYTFHPGFLTDPDGSNISNKNFDFLWNKEKLLDKNYRVSWQQMIMSLREIIKYSKFHKVPIAIESEGSINAKDHLLMQRPSEYKKLFEIFKNNEIGINLNIGHLNLASKAFNFDKKKFINKISKKIVAMELSHNFGRDDDHLPIRKNSWYWKIIKNSKYKNIPKILEFRDTNINTIKKIYKLLNK
ncbi:TIM barrel protein [Candidatus Pelagibacter sp.]|nr:TIM barrel protein [Candidatus Pelagibacter sp.]